MVVTVDKKHFPQRRKGAKKTVALLHSAFSLSVLSAFAPLRETYSCYRYLRRFSKECEA
jgi:hypothetical protein